MRIGRILIKIVMVRDIQFSVFVVLHTRDILHWDNFRGLFESQFAEVACRCIVCCLLAVHKVQWEGTKLQMGSGLSEPDMVVFRDVKEVSDELLGLALDLFELFAVGADVEDTGSTEVCA